MNFFTSTAGVEYSRNHLRAQGVAVKLTNSPELGRRVMFPPNALPSGSTRS